MLEFKSTLNSIEQINKDIFLITLWAPDNFKPCAGQFVQLRILENTSFILRRPLSIFDYAPGSFRILFRVRGKGTDLLSKIKTGMQVDILGPLGHGFDTKDTDEFILISGGIGFAPVHCLARQLERDGKKDKCLIIAGSATDDLKPVFENIEKQGFNITVMTDDGSFGKKGLVTEALAEKIKTDDIKNTQVFTCGPEPMLKAIADMTIKAGLRCQVSLESFMGCGVGACLCCVVEDSKDSYVRVCADGPVFSTDNINLQERWSQI